MRSWRHLYKALSAAVLLATVGGGVILVKGAGYIESAIPLTSLQHIHDVETLTQRIGEVDAALQLYAFDPTQTRRHRLRAAVDESLERLRRAFATGAAATAAQRDLLEDAQERLAALAQAAASDTMELQDFAPDIVDLQRRALGWRGELFHQAQSQIHEQRRRLNDYLAWMIGMIGLFGLFGFALVFLLRRHRQVIGVLQATEAASRELRERLAWILYGAHVGAWEWEAQSGRVNIDERWASILGYGLNELEPLTHVAWLDLIHPDDRCEAERRLTDHMRGETPYYECECRMRRKDGQWVWALDRARVISWTHDGAPLRMAGARLDVTERRRAENQLRRSESNIRAIMDNIPQGVVVLDRDGLILEYNLNAALLFNIEPEAYRRGRDFREILKIWAQTCGQSDEMFERALAEILAPEPFSLEFPQRVQGTMRWCALTHTPLPDGGCVRTFTDVTHAKATEDNLLRSNADLEQFAYGVSHDLRQPLRMVRSYGQLLSQRIGEKASDDEKLFLRYIIDAAVRMDQMLVSLLEYSRVGRSGEPMTPVSSRALVDEALLYLGPAVAEAQAQITLSGVWPTMTVSRDEMVRLFQNLIGNALKYRAEQRPVLIEVAAERREEDWLFVVRDNGVGVPPGQFDRLFKVFQRLHARDKYEGAGVGLALCRKIVERHGGRIWGESEGLDQGCVFYVALPLALASSL